MKSKIDKNKAIALKARKRMYQLVTKIEPKSITDINDSISRKDLRALLNLDIYLVNILCGPLDKYGRLLGWIFDISNKSELKSTSFNHNLLNENLAYEYQGNTKLSEEEQLKIFYN